MPQIPLRQAALLSLALLVACGGSERTGGAPFSVVYGGVFMGNDGPKVATSPSRFGRKTAPAAAPSWSTAR